MNKKYIDIKNATLQADGRIIILTENPVLYLQAGDIIVSNKTATTSTIHRIINNTSFVIDTNTGFTSGTSAVAFCDTFDGESLSKYFPKSVVTEDFIRYLHPFAQAIQDIYEYILNIPNLKDIALCPANLLQYLAKSKGIQLNSTDSEEIQREILKLIEYMYKHKGTKPSIEAAFAAKGYTAEVKELYCGKYINQVQTVSGTTVTIYVAGATLPASGSFSPKDILALSEGSGSDVPVKFDGVYGSIVTINSTYSFELSAEDAAKFSPDDYIIVYAYSYTRDSLNYPVTSSFINVLFTDRLQPPRTLTTEILNELVNYMVGFLPTYARLWAGTGIERVISILLSFRTDTEVVDHGPTLLMEPGNISIEVPIEWDGTYVTYLDDGTLLDEGAHLDAYHWMTMSVQINFERVALDPEETVIHTEGYTATTTP